MKDLLIPKNLFERLTTHAKKSLFCGFEIAKHTIEPYHILIGLLKEKGSLAYNILINHNITLSTEGFFKAKEINIKFEGILTNLFSIKKIDPSVKNIIKRTFSIGFLNNSSYIGTEHILLALIEELKKNKNAFKKVKIFVNKNITYKKLEKIKTYLKEVVQSNKKFPNFEKIFSSSVKTKQKPEKQKQVKKFKYLENFGTELVKRAKEGKLPKIYKREKEVELLIITLLREYKNNPIIIGDAGVGKTSLVYRLAEKIAKNDVPPKLINKKIYMIDLGEIVAGTIFRGDFEARIKSIINEAKDKDVILFIDEIHNLIGAGSAQGALDASNLLKAPLSSGEIQVIGATTFEEYRKCFEKDKALNRRFNPIYIEEMKEKDTIEVLKNMKKDFEKKYNIKINNNVIKKIVKYSSIYLPDKNFPEKAIDILDQSCAYLVSKNKKQNIVAKKINQIKDKKDILEKKLKLMILKENYEKAQEIVEKLKELENFFYIKLKKYKTKKLSLQTLNPSDVKEIFTKLTGRQITEIWDISQRKKLISSLKRNLKKLIIGQDEQIQKISNALKVALTNIVPKQKPLCSFLFLGPTGCGKTYTAKIIAQTIFKEKGSFIRFDMSEFLEPHTISRLIGSPPGYVGYEEGGELSEKIRKSPYALVLFDEIEKAHPNVLNLLLQILDEGHITDSQGRKINFKNTIIIMTSNIGSEYFNKKAFGFTEDKKDLQNQTKEKILSELKEFLRQELINRIENILVFNKLKEEDLKKIAELELDILKKELKKQGITFEVSKEVIDLVILKSNVLEQGARLIKNNIERIILNKVVDELYKNKKNIKITKEKIKNII